jgi:hypothetical protein
VTKTWSAAAIRLGKRLAIELQKPRFRHAVELEDALLQHFATLQGPRAAHAHAHGGRTGLAAVFIAVINERPLEDQSDLNTVASWILLNASRFDGTAGRNVVPIDEVRGPVTFHCGTNGSAQ